MESDNLYKVKFEDLPKLEVLLNKCFSKDPLYETLIPRSQQFPIMSLPQTLPKLWIVPQKICLEVCLIWMMSKKMKYHSMTDCLTKRCLV